MAKPQIDKTLTGLAGEFLVAGHLCIKGYVASLTLKNYPKVDIFCLNPKNQKQVAIQVKTVRNANAYYIPEHVDDSGNPFVFVLIKTDETVEFFIMPAGDVATLSRNERDEYLHAHPNAKREQPRMLSVSRLDPFRNRWDLLELD
jgi:hypothetical protein